MRTILSTLLGGALLALAAGPAQAQEATFDNPSLVPEVAMKAVNRVLKIGFPSAPIPL